MCKIQDLMRMHMNAYACLAIEWVVTKALPSFKDKNKIKWH